MNTGATLEKKDTTAIWKRALEVIPGGVSRDQLAVEPPIVIARGEAQYVWDVDGRRYTDFLNNYTSLIHGHVHAETFKASSAQLALGTVFGSLADPEVELGELLLARLLPGGRIRFTNSGTEANMLAIQIARALTSRSRIAKFEGGYHGSSDLMRISVKPKDGGDALKPTPEEEVGASGFGAVDILPFHSLAAARSIVESAGSEWSCVIVEPMQGSVGMIPSPPGLLEYLRDAADRFGFLLIFDEVMTFRLGVGGLQERFGVTPDLTTLGKIIGGGLPVGAVVGRADVMDVLAAPREPRLKHAGTYNGNPLTAVAGLATLRDFGEPQVALLNDRGEKLRSELNDRLRPIGVSCTGIGSLMNLHDSPKPPTCWRDIRHTRTQLIFELYLRLRERGHFLAPRGMICLSTAHSEGDLSDLASAIDELARDIF